MDNLLMLFDENVQNRYQTLLETIKNNSNTFYDSYNTLLEQFLRSICPCSVNGSISNIIKNNENKIFLLEEVLLPNKIYNKILDYALKINSHKHKLQKQVNEEIVISYMSLFYDVVYYYSKFVKYTIPSLNLDFYRNLYNKKNADETKINEILSYIEEDKNEKKKQEIADNYNKELNLKFRCGKYSIESIFSDIVFSLFKYSILLLYCLMFIFYYFVIANFTVSLLILLPSAIYYFVRVVKMMLENRRTKSKIFDFDKYTYINYIDNIIPIPTGKIKKSLKIIDFINFFTILFIAIAMNNKYGYILLVLCILSNFLYQKLKASYSILVLHTIDKDEYYDPLINMFVKKTKNGDFTL